MEKDHMDTLSTIMLKTDKSREPMNHSCQLPSSGQWESLSPVVVTSTMLFSVVFAPELFV